MAYVNPSTFVAGNVLTAAQMNVLANNDRFLHGPPTARVRATTSAGTSTSGVWTSVQFNTEDWDTDTMFSSTSNRKLICRTAGKYQVNFTAGIAASSAGSFRAIAIQKNTTTAGAGHECENLMTSTALSGVTYRLAVSQLIALTTGQFLRGEFIQNSGSALAHSTAVGEIPTLSAIWMSS